MEKRLNIFITDDDVFFLNALALVISAEEDFEVIGTAANGHDALCKIREVQPDIVLMDVKMPKMNGIDCIKQLKSDFPEMLIIILTTFNEEEYIIEGLANGANGYLIKGIDNQTLIQTIRDLTKGQYILPVEVATKLAKFTLSHLVKEPKNVLPEFITSSNTFTKKEYEIMKLIARRFSNKEIATKLFLSVGTLKNYLTIIYEKLGAKNRSEAISILTKQGE